MKGTPKTVPSFPVPDEADQTSNISRSPSRGVSSRCSVSNVIAVYSNTDSNEDVDIPIPHPTAPRLNLSRNAMHGNVFQHDFFKYDAPVGAVPTDDDADWKELIADVEKSVEIAHQNLFLKLRRAGSTSSAASTLLYKLIGICLRGYDFQPTQVYIDCGATIVLSVLRYIHLADYSCEATVTELTGVTQKEVIFFPTSSLEMIIHECMGHILTQSAADEYVDLRWIDVFVAVIDVIHGKGGLCNGQITLPQIFGEILELPFTNRTCIWILVILRSLPGMENAHVRTMFSKLHAFIASIEVGIFPLVVGQLLLFSHGKYSREIVDMATRYFSRNENDQTGTLRRHVLGTTILKFFETPLQYDTLFRSLQYHQLEFDKLENLFTLSLFLRLSEFHFLTEQLTNQAIRMMKNRFKLEDLSNSSRWGQVTTGIDSMSVLDCFRRLFQNRSSDFGFLHSSLMELGKGLLDHNDSSPSIQRQCSELGRYIITSVVRHGDNNTLEQQLSYLLKAAKTSLAHGETLADVLRFKAAHILMSSNLLGQVYEIVDQLFTLPSHSAVRIIVSLRDAFRLNHGLRTHLMLKLRKAASWRQEDTRISLVMIIGAILSYANLAGDLPMSQFSQHLSQLRGQSTDHERLPDVLPICLELLTLTRFCISAQSTVRAELYKNLFRVVQANPSLVELICNKLHEHGCPLLIQDEDGKPTINFAQMIEFKEDSANINPLIVKNELGLLTQSMCQVDRIARKTFNATRCMPPENLHTLQDSIGLWTRATLLTDVDMIQAASSEVVLQNGTNVGYELQVESVFRVQLRQVIESLIEFLVFNDNEESDAIIRKLFARYIEFAEPFAESQQKHRRSGKYKPDKGKKGAIDDCPKNIAVIPMKKIPFLHVYQIESLSELFRKFYSQTTPLTAVSRRHGEEFESMLLEATNQSIEKSERMESTINEQDDAMLADVARSIWRAFWNSSCIPTDNVLMSRLMTLSRIATVTTNQERLLQYLCNGSIEESISVEQNFLLFFDSWQTVFDATIQLDVSELRASLLDFLSKFANTLTPLKLSQTISAWCWAFMATQPGDRLDSSAPPSSQLADSVISCWLKYYLRAYSDLKKSHEQSILCEDVCTVAKVVRLAVDLEGDEDITDRVLPNPHMWIINSDTARVTGHRIWEVVGGQLELLDVLLKKIDCSIDDNEHVSSNATSCRLFDSSVSRLRQLLTISHELVASRALVIENPMITVSVPIITNIFNVINGFAKHLKGLHNTVQFQLLAPCFVPVLEFVETEFMPAVEIMITMEQTTFNRSILNSGKSTKAFMKSKLASDKRLYPKLAYQMEAVQQTFQSLTKKLDDKHSGTGVMKRRKSRTNDTESMLSTTSLNVQSPPQQLEIEPVAGPSKPPLATDFYIPQPYDTDSD